MKKEVKPRLKPSQRSKKRYILFQYGAEKRASFRGVRELFKRLSIPSLALIEFNSSSGKGIVRCERSKAAAVRKTLNEIGFTTLKTSGTLKKLRNSM